MLLNINSLHNILFLRVQPSKIMFFNLNNNLKHINHMYKLYFFKLIRVKYNTNTKIIKDFNIYFNKYLNNVKKTNVKLISLFFIFLNFKKIYNFFINYLLQNKLYFIITNKFNKYLYYFLNIVYKYKIINKLNYFFKRKNNKYLNKFIYILKKKKINLLIFFDILKFNYFLSILKNIQIITIGFNNFFFSKYLYSYNILISENSYFIRLFYLLVLIKISVFIKKYLQKNKIKKYMLSNITH
jgi:hypothetical protein